MHITFGNFNLYVNTISGISLNYNCAVPSTLRTIIYTSVIKVHLSVYYTNLFIYALNIVTTNYIML